MKFFRGMLRDKKGAALVEYGLLVAGVALIASAAVAIAILLVALTYGAVALERFAPM